MVMQYVVVGVVVFAAVVYCVMKIVRTIKRAAKGGDVMAALIVHVPGQSVIALRERDSFGYVDILWLICLKIFYTF